MTDNDQAIPGDGTANAEQPQQPPISNEFVAVGAEQFDDTPTPEQAKHIFLDRPDCAAIMTTEGRMLRDGSFAPA